jgi:diguanylate cyclase
MAEGAINPTPSNYEFWYRYVTGADRDIVDAVDAVRRTVGFVDARAMKNIHLEIYGGAGKDGLGRLIAAAESQLDRVTGITDRAGGDARDYRGRLGEGQALLADGMGPEQQKALIADMLAATNAMVEKAAELENELISSGREIDALKADLEIARRESRTDALTGLANRKACADYLEAHVDRAGGTQSVSLIYLDIDHFKSFNDTHGHRLGDEVLRLVGQCLEKTFHGLGLVARWGGEEFLVVMPRLPAGEAVAIAERFRIFISSRTVRATQSQTDVGRITLSLGVAIRNPGETALALIDRADRALYRAKDRGRNQVVLDGLAEERAAA